MEFVINVLAWIITIWLINSACFLLSSPYRFGFYKKDDK